MNGFGKVFGGFILLFVLISVGLTVFFFTSMYMRKASSAQLARERNPPRSYAEYVGLKCPDGFTYAGVDPQDSKKHLCKNVLGVMIHEGTDSNNNPICGNYDAQTKLAKFTNLDWNQLSPKDYQFPRNADGVDDICNFVSQCGPTSGKRAQWTGVDTQNGWVRCSV